MTKNMKKENVKTPLFCKKLPNMDMGRIIKNMKKENFKNPQFCKKKLSNFAKKVERHFPFYSKIDKSQDNFIEVKVKITLLDDQNEVLYISVSQIVPEI